MGLTATSGRGAATVMKKAFQILQRTLSPEGGGALALRRSESGAVAVEFSMLIPLIVVMLLGALDLAYIYLAKTELSRITQDVGRVVRLGNAQSLSGQTFQSMACADIVVILQCSGLIFNLTPYTSCATLTNTAPQLTYDSNGNVTNNLVFNPGGPGDIDVLQISYQLPVFGTSLFNYATQTNGTMLITASAVFYVQ